MARDEGACRASRHAIALVRAIRFHGPARGWKNRRRGRKLEWLESSLPPETQKALADARASCPAANVAPRLPDERLAVTADARLEVLGRLDRWLEDEQPDNIDQALCTFAERYNEGHVATSLETRAEIPRLSRTTLIRWRQARREGRWTGLMPDRRGLAPRAAGIPDEELADAIGAFILEFHPHEQAEEARDWLIAKFPEKQIPTLRAVRRWMERWRKANSSLLEQATNPDRYRSRRLPAFGDAAAGIERINQLWEVDSSPADILCTDGRHTLIAVLEVYSRRALVIVAPTSSSRGIAALLRRALLEWGVPEVIRSDEGSDYTSRHVRRALADLEIEHDILPPYSPELKPFVERFFGTIQRKLIAYLPGFAGHSVADRQAIRSKKSFAARRGKSDRETFGVKLASDELQQRIDDWLLYKYERRPHKGLGGRAPFEAAAGQRVRSVGSERALDILLAPPPGGRNFRQVGKEGVKVDGGTYIAPDLGPFAGLDVEIRKHPEDHGIVYVYAGNVLPAGMDIAKGDFVCMAEDPSRLGMTHAEVAAKSKANAKAANAAGRAHARELKRRFRPELASDAILGAARQDAGQVVAFPSRSSAHETPALTEADRTQGATTDHTLMTPGFRDVLKHAYGDKFLKRSGGV